VADIDFLVATGTRRPSQRVLETAKWAADTYGGPSVLLIVGDADGFDAAIRREWFERGWPMWRHDAPWDAFRQAWGSERAKLAGPARNEAMAGAARKLLRRGLRGKGVAAPDSKSQGTWDCIRDLENAGLTVEVRNV
jgi:hypothetical protein